LENLGRWQTETFQRRQDTDAFRRSVEADELRGTVVDVRRSLPRFEEYATQWLATCRRPPPIATSTPPSSATPSWPPNCRSPPRRPKLAVDADLSTEHLDIYSTREGEWNPEHGVVDIPDGWELLVSGDAFVTRTVKAAGVYWLGWNPRTRSRAHRQLIGLWAPTETIEAARAKAADTAAARAKARVSGARQRERQEQRYQAELTEAILRYLDFAPRDAPLAAEIAREAAARAAVVGSGRVGRTQMIPVEERAVLAARAYIRHRHTRYEDELDRGAFRDGWDAEFLYRDIKTAAQAAVDDFIETHRQP
jgi:hypothetical protein